MKKLITIFSIALICATSFAQYDMDSQYGVLWNDSHNLINSELAVQNGITDKPTLINKVISNFDSLRRKGIINDDLCQLYYINSYVDFVDYILGYWDTDFSTETPDRVQAPREDEADATINDCWSKILGYMKLKMDDMTLDSEIITDEIMRLYRTMTAFQVVHDSSPDVRVTLPEKRRAVRLFLGKIK